MTNAAPRPVASGQIHSAGGKVFCQNSELVVDQLVPGIAHLPVDVIGAAPRLEGVQLLAQVDFSRAIEDGLGRSRRC